MFTLIQVLTQDSVAHLIRDIQVYVRFSWAFFFYMSVGTLVLMNLVTAIIVDTAVAKNNDDRETRARHKMDTKTKILRRIKELWSQMDVDRGGSISTEELKAAIKNPEVQRLWEELDIKVEEWKDL